MQDMQTVCITGGLGFIGSHICIQLLEQNYKVIIIDSSSCYQDTLDRIIKITNREPIFYQCDLCNYDTLEIIFKNNKIDVIIHCAAFKSIPESLKSPLAYYDNNITGTLNLLKAMQILNMKKLIFSSSATVYGIQNISESIKEDTELQTPTNPYGKTKLYIEEILRDLVKSDDTWKIIILRYFNPAGAHPSGYLGEKINSYSTNLMPLLLRTASHNQTFFTIYGNDYPTSDGTCIRDFIHIMDLAEGHIAALKYLNNLSAITEINLGTGTGCSILTIIETMKQITKKDIPYIYASRREGDIPICFANVDKALQLLDWQAKHTIEDICRDAWNWYNNLNTSNYTISTLNLSS